MFFRTPITFSSDARLFIQTENVMIFTTGFPEDILKALSDYFKIDGTSVKKSLGDDAKLGAYFTYNYTEHVLSKRGYRDDEVIIKEETKKYWKFESSFADDLEGFLTKGCEQGHKVLVLLERVL